MRFDSQKKSFRISFFLTSVVFVVSRTLYFVAGIRFDSTPLLWFDQILDPYLLKNDLLQSMFYLHLQPPLFNLFIGCILKIFPNNFALAFHFCFLLAGLLIMVTLFFTLKVFSVPPVLCLILTCIFMCSPSSILYENWLFYTHPLCALLIISAFLLYKFLQSEDIKYGVLFFSVLALAILTRTVFHILWFLLILFWLVHYKKEITKTICLAAMVPLLVTGCVYAKNWYVFGDFPGSTAMGMSLYKIAGRNIDMNERIQLVRAGKLSEVSKAEPYRELSSYPDSITKMTDTDIPVLDQRIRTTGFNNLNHQAYRQISKMYLADAIYLITHHTKSYAKSVSQATSMYFRSSGELIFLKRNLQLIQPIQNFYNRFFYGNFSGNSEGTYWFLIIGLPSLILFTGLRIKSWTALGKEYLPKALTLFYMLMTVLYTAAVCNTMEIDENNRYRYEVDPFYVVMLGIFLAEFLRKQSKANVNNAIRCSIIFGLFLTGVFSSACVRPPTTVSGQDQELFSAIRRGDAQKVSAMLRTNVAAKARTSTGWTPLMTAIETEQTDIARLLIESGSDVNARSDSGKTALIVAVKKGSVLMVQSLIAAGADPNWKEKTYETAFVHAAFDGNVQIVQELFKGNVNSSNMTQALIVAASQRRAGVVKYLLARGANPSASNPYGVTALIVARHLGDTETQLLLLHASSSVREQP